MPDISWDANTPAVQPAQYGESYVPVRVAAAPGGADSFAQIDINGLLTALAAETDPSDVNALVAQVAAAQAQASAAFQNALSTSVTAGGTLPNEVTQITGGGGTGGTPGTYAGGVSGTVFPGFTWHVLVGSDGKAIPIIDTPGIGTGSTAPTLVMPTIAGLTGATTPTAIVGAIPNGRLFSAPSADGTQSLAWMNAGGMLTAVTFNGTQFGLAMPTALNNALASARAIASQFFDPQPLTAAITTGGYVRPGGTIGTNASFQYATIALTGYETEVDVTFRMPVATANEVAGLIWKDGTGTILRVDAASDGAAHTYIDSAFTPPIGAQQLLISGDASFTIAAVARESNTPVPKGFLSLYASMTSWTKQVLSLGTPGFYNPTNGGFTANSGYNNITLPLTGAELGLRVTSRTNGTAMAAVVFFADAGLTKFLTAAFVGGSSAADYTDALGNNVVAKVPTAARAAVITSWVGGSPVLAPGVEILTMTQAATSIASLLTSSSVYASAIASLSALAGNWSKPTSQVLTANAIWRNGTTSALTNYGYVTYNVTGLETGFAATGNTNATAGFIALASYVDGNGNVTTEHPATGGSDPQTHLTINPPPGTKQIILCGRIDGTNQLFLEVETPSNYWAGRTILWCGTSIPAGAGPTNNYPYLIGRNIGATVNNVAVGLSCMRAGRAGGANGAVVVGSITSGVLTVSQVLYGAVAAGAALSPAYVSAGCSINAQTGGTAGGVGTYSVNGSPPDVAAGTTIFIGADPLGWTGRDWNNITRALTHTIGEKNELILNWSKWQPLLTGSPPATLDAPTQANILSWSYQNRILPNIAAATVWIIDHGYNDMVVGGSDAEVSAVPANSRDRCTFIGATNWLIDQVQSYLDGLSLPPAHIAFSGHYENEQHPGIATAQQYLASLWQFPINKLWERTGWSQQTITTTGFWTGVPGTWTTSGGSPQTITYKQRALPDDLHPHNDLSGAGTQRLVDLSNDWVRGLR